MDNKIRLIYQKESAYMKKQRIKRTIPSSCSKMSGRWTKEEHKSFLEALKLFGKNWKKVEEHVGTRTGAQIRSHAQKFFNRLERQYNTNKSNDSMINYPNYDSGHQKRRRKAKKAERIDLTKTIKAPEQSYRSSCQDMEINRKILDYQETKNQILNQMRSMEKIRVQILKRDIQPEEKLKALTQADTTKKVLIQYLKYLEFAFQYSNNFPETTKTQQGDKQQNSKMAKDFQDAQMIYQNLLLSLQLEAANNFDPGTIDLEELAALNKPKAMRKLSLQNQNLLFGGSRTQTPNKIAAPVVKENVGYNQQGQPKIQFPNLPTNSFQTPTKPQQKTQNQQNPNMGMNYRMNINYKKPPIQQQQQQKEEVTTNAGAAYNEMFQQQSQGVQLEKKVENQNQQQTIEPEPRKQLKVDQAQL